MKLEETLIWGAVAAGGFYLWQRFGKDEYPLRGSVAVPLGTPPEVATCMVRKADRGWDAAQCRARLTQVEAAYRNDLAQLAIARTAGDATRIRNWEDAAFSHRAEYYALTGVALTP